MNAAKWTMVCAAVALTAAGVSAQDPAPSLQDLVGARGGDGEYQLEQRGYTFLRTEKSGDSAYSYWRENENGQCIVVRTTEGRYASIVFAPAFDCQGGGSDASQSGEGYDRKDEFQTVCGVIVNGQTYRYKCKAVDFYRGSENLKTALHYPDQTVRLVWKSGNEVVLHFEGMKAQHARYSRSEGETNFYFEDKTYFYISDTRMAEMEVRNFRD